MKNEENTLIELNAMLFDELKRLNNPNLTKDELEKEIHRATAIKNNLCKISLICIAIIGTIMAVKLF